MRETTHRFGVVLLQLLLLAHLLKDWTLGRRCHHWQLGIPWPPPHEPLPILGAGLRARPHRQLAAPVRETTHRFWMDLPAHLLKDWSLGCLCHHWKLGVASPILGEGLPILGEGLRARRQRRPAASVEQTRLRFGMMLLQLLLPAHLLKDWSLGCRCLH